MTSLKTLTKRWNLATHIAWCATHTDTRLGCDCFCYLAEAVAPGFTEATWDQIRAKVVGDYEKNQESFVKAKKLIFNGRWWMKIHLFLLKIGCSIVERHDPIK